jgi:hypothetical protein
LKELALELAKNESQPGKKLNLVRELIQATILRTLHECEAFNSLSFVGGTALRFLENLPRFSEDLDFSLMNEKNYEPEKWLKTIKSELSAAGYNCTITWNNKRVVNVAWIKIKGLLYEMGVAAMPDQNLSIKLEIDTKPPAGGKTKKSIINRHLTFLLHHHDMPSLMAGKVHALLCRPYSKGRDWYDLVWYCSHRPPIEPDLQHLQFALDQTQGKGKVQANLWKKLVIDKYKTLSTAEIISDVEAFLERPEDKELLKLENMIHLFK